MKRIVQKIVNRLKAAERLLLVTHIDPDGDNLGSALALLEVLKKLGKEAIFYLECEVPRTYRWLPGAELTRTELPSKEGARWTVVVLDSADLNRIGGPFLEWYEGSIPIINIDHHVSNSIDGHVNWVAEDYSSTGEQVIELIDAFGLELTRSIATNIFCAVYTDTGRFSYSNTNLRSMSIAQRCVEAGAVPYEAYREVYSSRTLGSLKLQCLALRTLRFFGGGSGCAFHVDDSMYEQTGTDSIDTEGFVELVAQVDEAKIVVFFRDSGNGRIKGSLRCREPVDAHELASRFDGGGHPRAAGFSVQGTIEDAYEIFIAEAEKFLAVVGGKKG